MNKKYTLTEEGLKAIKDEYEQLKIDRDLNIKAIQDARSQGDLSENADYDAARAEQAQVEGRIQELEKIMEQAEIIEKSRTGMYFLGKKKIKPRS